MRARGEGMPTTAEMGGDGRDVDVLFQSPQADAPASLVLVLIEDERGWRVSLRGLEKNLDVAAIAAEFGGGGHPRAAGAHLEGGEAEKQAFIAKVAQLVAAIPEADAVLIGGKGG